MAQLQGEVGAGNMPLPSPSSLFLTFFLILYPLPFVLPSSLFFTFFLGFCLSLCLNFSLNISFNLLSFFLIFCLSFFLSFCFGFLLDLQLKLLFELDAAGDREAGQEGLHRPVVRQATPCPHSSLVIFTIILLDRIMMVFTQLVCVYNRLSCICVPCRIELNNIFDREPL